jgi:8-oxo-dGTP pyrophosphatase MutT (NUDIX family)
MTETAIRETMEETGMTIEATDLVGIYSDTAHILAFLDGEVPAVAGLCSRAARRRCPYDLSANVTDVPRSASAIVYAR